MSPGLSLQTFFRRGGGGKGGGGWGELYLGSVQLNRRIQYSKVCLATLIL